MANLLAPENDSDGTPSRPSWVRHNAALAIAKIAGSLEPGDLPAGLEEALEARVQAHPANDPYVNKEAAGKLAHEHDDSSAGAESCDRRLFFSSASFLLLSVGLTHCLAFFPRALGCRWE